ncbi:hypothetical protein IFM89_025795 [Coptis chinensis]|uniref:Uncharacterized protein n=1 Tax=Coptis chinensis TaxID=261450 RepID=A0A835LJR3_9MAGN|nr:hypothetical protein IFM89_025795 [Coptis chinensis]
MSNCWTRCNRSSDPITCFHSVWLVSLHTVNVLMDLVARSGFYVARTKDGIKGAKEKKGCCIEEMNVVDVQIGRVHIVVVPRDCSTLAACVGAKIYFFEIELLLNKELRVQHLSMLQWDIAQEPCTKLNPFIGNLEFRKQLAEVFNMNKHRILAFKNKPPPTACDRQ